MAIYMRRDGCSDSTVARVLGISEASVHNLAREGWEAAKSQRRRDRKKAEAEAERILRVARRVAWSREIREKMA